MEHQVTHDCQSAEHQLILASNQENTSLHWPPSSRTSANPSYYSAKNHVTHDHHSAEHELTLATIQPKIR